ncbi:hypothetical protein [Streptomyces cinereoruber]|uniref:hypothetical protein n=1 Tax=Streptomyces cinereoruber TaxID=67260 RepID=UPI00364FEC5B
MTAEAVVMAVACGTRDVTGAAATTEVIMAPARTPGISTAPLPRLKPHLLDVDTIRSLPLIMSEFGVRMSGKWSGTFEAV